MSFDGQVVLVTGASGGIGHAICRRFATMGARVAAHYGHNAEAATALVASLEGPGHFSLSADLADPAAVETLVEQTVAEGGRLDVLVNNAGVFGQQPPTGEAYEAWQAHWRKTLDVNLLGPANTSYCAVRHMRRQGGGRIINISSRGAFRGEPDNPAYGASKAGLNALSQSLALALAGDGIYVFAVAPGFVETAMARPYLTGEMASAIRNQSPLGRVARAEEVAYWVTCLAAEGAEFATGTIIDVNGASYLRS